MGRFTFENLEVYQIALDFVDLVYKITAKFPNSEQFGLTSQLRRASVSICLNVAEGYSRGGKEFSRFVDMARGSVFECAAVFQIALRQRYLDKAQYDQIESTLIRISKMLSGLKSSLQKVSIRQPITNYQQPITR